MGQAMEFGKPKLYRWKVMFIFDESNPTQECLCSCNSARAKVKICSACDLLHCSQRLRNCTINSN